MAINTIAELREYYPDLADASDEAVVDAYSTDTGLSADAVRTYLGAGVQAAPEVVDDDPSDVINALATYKNQIEGLSAGAGALAADSVGATGLRDRLLESYRGDMEEMQARQREQYELEYLKSDEAGLGDYIDAAQYYGALGLANLGGALVSGGLGSVVGQQVAKQGLKKYVGREAREGALERLSERAARKGAARGFTSGVGASAVAQEVGATYGQAVEEQEAQGFTADEVDNMRAFLAGTAAGSLEFASDVFLLGAGRFLPDGAVGKVGEFATSGGVVTRAAKGLSVAAPVEAATEVGQTLLEDYGAKTEISFEEVDYRNKLWQAAFAGAAAGGIAGGVVAGLRSDSRQVETDPDAPTVPDQDPDAPTAPDIDINQFANEDGVITPESRDAMLKQLVKGEDTPVQEYVDMTLVAPGRTKGDAESAINEAFSTAASTPSGAWVTDPETQVERELNLGELIEQIAITRNSFKYPRRLQPKSTLPVLYEGRQPHVRVVDSSGQVTRHELEPDLSTFEPLLDAAVNQLRERAGRPAQQIENLVDEPDSITPPDTAEKAEKAKLDALAQVAKVKDPKPKKTVPTTNRTDPIFQTEAGRTALNENATESGQPNRQLQVLLANYRKRDTASLIQGTINNWRTAPWKKALAAEVVAERGGNITQATQQQEQTTPAEDDTPQVISDEQAIALLELDVNSSEFGFSNNEKKVWEFVRDSAFNDEMEAIVSLSGKNTKTGLSPLEIGKRLGLPRSSVDSAIKGVWPKLERFTGAPVKDVLGKINSMRRKLKQEEAAITGDEISDAEVVGATNEDRALVEQQDEEVEAVAQEELSEGAGLTIRPDGRGAFSLGFIDTSDRAKIVKMLTPDKPDTPEDQKTYDSALDETMGAEYELQTNQKDWNEMTPRLKSGWVIKLKEETGDTVENEAAAREEDAARQERAQEEHQEMLDLFMQHPAWSTAVEIYDTLIQNEANDAMQVPFADLESGYQELIMRHVATNTTVKPQVRQHVEKAISEIAYDRQQEAADVRVATLGRGESQTTGVQQQPTDQTVRPSEPESRPRQQTEEQLAKEGKIKQKRRRTVKIAPDGTPLRAVEFAGKPETGMTRAKAKVVANRIIKSRGWRTEEASIHVEVVETYDRLPQEVQDLLPGSSDWLGGVEYTKGDVSTVYLIADMHANELELESTMVHELIHAASSKYHGAERFFVDSSIALGMGRDNLLALAESFGVRDTLLQYEGDFAREGYSYAASQGILFEEMLAYTAGSGRDKGITNRIKAAVGEFRQWLRRMGLLRTSEIGETEVLALIRRLHRTMEGTFSSEYGFWTSDTGDAAVGRAQTLELDQAVPLNAIATEGGPSVVEDLVAGKPMDSYVDEVIGIMDAAVASGRYESFTDDAGRLSIRPVAANWKNNKPGALGGAVTPLQVDQIREGLPVTWRDGSPPQYEGKSVTLTGRTKERRGVIMVQYGVADYYTDPSMQDQRTQYGYAPIYEFNTSGGNLPSALAGGVTRQKQQTTSMLGALTDKIASKLEDMAPGVVNAYQKGELGFMTLEQINDFAKRIELPEVGNYVAAVHRIQRTSKVLRDDAHRLNTTWGKLRSQKPEQINAVHKLMLDTTLAEYDPSVDQPATPEQKKLKARWNRLDGDVQKLYTAVRDRFKSWHDEKVEILQNAILDAEAAGNAPQLERVKADLESMKKLKGPYFPLKRLDKYYVVGMSGQLKALMDKNDEAPLVGQEKALLRQLRKDPNHYRVESYRTLKDAKQRSKQLTSKMGASYYQESVDKFKPEVSEVPDIAVIRSYFMNADLNDESKGKIESILQYMYADMLPANAAAKSQMKREGVAGADSDMQRVFSDSAIKNSHQISRLKHSKEVNQALVDVRQMGSGQDQGDVTRVRNEVLARANMVYDHENTPIADTIMTGSFLAHLGLSPAYIATNFSQVGMITLPWLAARPGRSVNDTLAAVGKAYKDAAKIIYSNYVENGWRTEFDWKGKVTDGESAMLTELLERNKLDVTIEHDLTATAEGSSPWTFTRSNDYLQMANLPVRITELNNRAVTALAAYRLELKSLKGKKMSQEQRHAKAVEYAVNAVNETQLDYSGLNTARYMQKVMGSRDLAKVMFQFRKYQQGMVSLVMKNIKDGMGRAGVDKARQAEARNTLFGLFTTTGIMAGAVGMPLAGTIAAVAEIAVDVFGEDDEPFDAELALREYISEMFGGGEEGADMARMVMMGLPTQLGVDVSKRIGMGDILFPLPFIRDGSGPRETLAEALIASLGAAPSYGIQAVEGGVILWDAYRTDELEDKWMGAGAKIAPVKGVQNLLKGWNLSEQGLRERSGDPILEPEQLTANEVLMRSLGFLPSKLSDYYTANSRRAEVKSAIDDARSDLMRRYAQAKLEGKHSKLRAVRKEIREFNQRNRQRRSARITSQNLQSAFRYRKDLRRDRTASGLRGGRQYQDYNEDVEFITGARP